MTVRTTLLSAERLIEAKAEATDLLEYSIYTFCTLFEKNENRQKEAVDGQFKKKQTEK